MQKRIIRTIANAGFTESTSPLFAKFELLKLQDIHKFYCVLDTHEKIKNGLYRISHGRNTRNCNMALPKFHKLTRCQQSCSFKGPTFWNQLPDEIRCIESTSNFKKKVKSHYISMYNL